MPSPPGVRYAGVGDEAAPALAQQIAAHRALGWQDVELRTVDGLRLAELAPAAVERVCEALDASGLRVAAVLTNVGAWGRSVATPLALDVEELRATAPIARRLGTDRLRVMSFANAGLDDAGWRAEAIRRLRALAREAEDLGVVLLHENCAGWAGQGWRQTLELLEAVDSPALRALFDVGNGVAYGYEALEFLERTLPWIAQVHVKDAVRGDGDVRYVDPGAGEAGVAACLRALLDAGWSGVWTIEPHLHVAPHAGEVTAPDAAREAFVAYGRRFEALVAREVLGTARGAAA